MFKMVPNELLQDNKISKILRDSGEDRFRTCEGVSPTELQTTQRTQK